MPLPSSAVVQPPPSGGRAAGPPGDGGDGEAVERYGAVRGDRGDVRGGSTPVDAGPPGRPPVLDPDVRADAAPTLKVAAVARRLGVAPATLRTWARRYGLGPSAHTAGAHRQYSLADLDRLMVMRRMTLEGYSPAEAARVALRTPAPEAAPGAVAPPAPTGGAAGTTPAPRREPPQALRAVAPSVRSLARAASTLQGEECARQLEAHVAVGGVLETWTTLVRPVLQAFSDRVGAVAPGRSPGLLLEAALLQALRSTGEERPGDGSRTDRDEQPRVLVLRPCEADPPVAAAGVPSAAAGDLLAHVVAAALRESGADALVLPGPHPAERVAAVAEQVDAAALVVVADGAVAAGRVAETSRLVDPRGARVVLAGRGWEDERLPGVDVVADLGDAVAAVAGV